MIQSGAIAAVLVYFRADIARLIRSVARGRRSTRERRGADWREAWHVAAASTPIGVVGLAANGVIEGRSAAYGWSARR